MSKLTVSKVVPTLQTTKKLRWPNVVCLNVLIRMSREWWTVDEKSLAFKREVIVLILLFSLCFFCQKALDQ